MKLVDLLRSSPLERKISEKIAGDLLKISPECLFLLKNNLVVSPAKYIKFKKAEKAIVERGVPYQYVLEKSWFYGREFIVNKDVLIPRVETEILLREAIKFLVASSKYHVASKKQIQIIDVGTGSGCIAISLATEIAKLETGDRRLETKLFATDISEKALSVARKNAEIHKAKINFLKSDLLDNPKLPEKFDLILANLPYLPSADITKENSICHEPRAALDGGNDGLDLVKKLIVQLPNRLAKNGLAILEIDPRQKERLKNFLKKIPHLKFKFKKDLNSRTRFVFIKN